jgi:hypothetical protein
MGYGEVLVSVTAIVLGSAILLIPLAGLTARFAIRPLIETWSRNRIGAPPEYTLLLERRVGLLEEQLDSLLQETGRLREEADFRRELHASTDGAARPATLLP